MCHGLWHSLLGVWDREQSYQTGGGEEIGESNELPSDLLAICQVGQSNDADDASHIERDGEKLGHSARVAESLNNRRDREGEAVHRDGIAPPDDHAQVESPLLESAEDGLLGARIVHVDVAVCGTCIFC